MPPKQTVKKTTGAGRGRPTATSKKPVNAPEPDSSNPFELSDDQDQQDDTALREGHRVEDEEPEPEKTIPKDLLTRLLHEFFTKDATRISKDANAATGKYFDVFVREAIARAAVEKEGGFLEVEDLEKISPQLLLDL
ncbi:CENP-S associating centromere protein X-domain-containing protein [Mariannaea sp. PMI_226]|nr:CENP-S associating centromere protein X-domain-containing protein [Mariannaea sp. PMI_226]